MKKNAPHASFSFARLYCSIFGHRYITSRKVTHHIREYTCVHCGAKATINSKGKLEALTPKLEEINTSLLAVHTKKAARNRDKDSNHPNNLQAAS